VALGTALLGVGFGLSAAPLNRYPSVFFQLGLIARLLWFMIWILANSGFVEYF
jgi:hypothetical protein